MNSFKGMIRYAILRMTPYITGRLRYRTILLVLFMLIMPTPGKAQNNSKELRELIQRLKEDPRGPYHRIRWFCEDGSVREARDPCPDSIGGGIQHASYKKEIETLAKEQGIYLGQILAATPQSEFWTPEAGNPRLLQYQLGNYLARVDDGWILRKAKFYRGAVQSEDESAWGKEFYQNLLKDPEVLREYYFLIRQSMKDIPFRDETDLGRAMRDLSKVIADKHQSFMDARTKIHGNPEPEDAQLVSRYLENNAKKLDPESRKKLSELLEVIMAYHSSVNLEGLSEEIASLSKENPLRPLLHHFIDSVASTGDLTEKMQIYSEMLCELREGITTSMKPTDRITLLALSLDIEQAMRKNYSGWKAETLEALLERIYILGKAAMGAGFIEISEWNEVQHTLRPPSGNTISLEELERKVQVASDLVAWASGMIEAHYRETVDRYASFEPLAYGFTDDLMRSSIVLELGDSVSELSEFVASESGLRNSIFSYGDQGGFRGINPGVAKGTLEIVDGNPENLEVDPAKIYVFQRPPSDLKPVGGILSASEGNLVSHVQLLARNLGIPNAILQEKDIERLRPYEGKMVFYAVSSAGNMVLKEAEEMTAGEKALFDEKERDRSRIRVPVESIQLDIDSLLQLREIDADVSGILSGPKAANLGELKSLFPEHVVEGLVIPFGLFRDHMNQQMPGTNGTYWEYLEETFREAKNREQNGQAEDAVESFQLSRLATLRNAIKDIALSNALVDQLEQGFKAAFGTALGETPVFLRSDTNMEDLPNFTGAGLNLTLFNVRDKEKILQGIRDVWASPYSERSFKWRQQLLENPENVYPSILIIPTVDVAYSGVMITKGINRGDEDAITVAVSRGAGGAVDGQSAETWLITENSRQLLSPSRQQDYIRLPETGGKTDKRKGFDELILSEKNIGQLRDLAAKIRYKIPESDPEHTGPYDVEFGFLDDHLWLFQIRPFVENKNAISASYLQGLLPETDRNKMIQLSQKLK